MKKILVTERLILRHLEVEDADFILELVNTYEWLEYIGDKHVRTIEDATNYILNGPFRSYRENGYGLWVIELKELGTRIGLCGLLKREALENIDIGFALLPQFFRLGYGCEIVNATKHYANSLLKIDKLVAIVNHNNLASIKLLNKVGFNFERTLTNPEFKSALLFSATK